MVPAMAGFLMLAALVAWLAFVVCVLRALRLFAGWMPAAATVWRSDYTENQQSDDFWSMGMTLFSLRGWNWRDGDDTRYIEDEIRFHDQDGVERRTIVHRWVHRGWQPSGVYTVWYDAADPEKATVLGPFTWALWAALSLVLACVALHALAGMGGMAAVWALIPSRS